MKKIIGLALIFTLLFSMTVVAVDKSAVNDAAEYVYKSVPAPVVDTIGGEWAVIGLLRSGYDVPSAWVEGYYNAVVDYVNAHGGVLHDRKYTEYSRVILGLTAAGYDPRNVDGYDLTAPLADFEKTIWQGTNGSIFALIALDSRNYLSELRGEYVAEILRRQLDDGGFKLASGGGKDEKADPDITAMALQALAKYRSQPEVEAAVAGALACLSAMQDADGGFSGWDSASSESVVQAIIALCELGISLDDPRFVKNGKSLLDKLLTYKNDDGSFNHTEDGEGSSRMSAEQALCALAAVHRAAEGRNSLYNMTDTPLAGGMEDKPQVGLAGKHSDVTAQEVVSPGKTFADTAAHENKYAIEQLAARGIINGKSDNEFDPNATVTRAEYAAIVTRGLGLPHKLHSFTFTDVQPGDWHFDYVFTAYEYRIVSGVGEGMFNPDGTITRQEAAVMTARAAAQCGMKTELNDDAIRNILAQFGDYKAVADWAGEAMAFCFDSGILSDEDFDIQPGAAVKRCEIAQMLFNMLSKAKLLL